jgi:DnaK suppressor protein
VGLVRYHGRTIEVQIGGWMKESERAQVEERLQQERERAIEALEKFERQRSDSREEASGELSSYPFHMADVATDAIEQEKRLLLESREGELLWAIDEALRRLYGDPESFGICEQCGRQISLERLDVLPWTTLCADCARDGKA